MSEFEDYILQNKQILHKIDYAYYYVILSNIKSMPARNPRRKRRRLSHRQRQRRYMREYYCQKRACNIFDGLEKAAANGWGRRQKSYYDQYGGGEWSATAEYSCECHQCVHTVEVIYVRNPIDVNLMAWYRDGKKLSYIMM